MPTGAKQMFVETEEFYAWASVSKDTDDTAKEGRRTIGEGLVS